MCWVIADLEISLPKKRQSSGVIRWKFDSTLINNQLLNNVSQLQNQELHVNQFDEVCDWCTNNKLTSLKNFPTPKLA